MTELLPETDRDACARDAMTAIEVALDRLSPEARSAFWTAIDRLYRLPVEAGGPPAGAAPRHRSPP
ncbi:hypothetical protein FF100_13045 [Methylobacterium terricola]|uniref:Uncharacterized protein n=1 Tax=Methylobacterium terricola TaxID=2583531 RepID=A0A5C4LJM7_9HYPH|nr:hypothetical protein [Methylobacterium terricola]TNC13688.1 hypothetical protein FF100_13045 [Methylobacterium terricola]